MGKLWTALASYVGSGFFWLCDKIWGDAVFARIKPMIPDRALAGFPLSDIVGAALSYGPPIVLVLIGSALFWSGRKRLTQFINDETPPPTQSNRPLCSSIPKSELDWNFERDTAFIGMSAGPEQQILIHNFQARGKNLSGDPIMLVSGFVRSDRTSQQFPLMFNVKGNATPPEQINPIPVGAHIDTHASFFENGRPITIQKFLTEIVPFTFFFEYDGKQVRRTVTSDEVEIRIAEYGKTIRRSLETPPQITARPQHSNVESRDKIDPSIPFNQTDASGLHGQVQFNMYLSGNTAQLGPDGLRFSLRFSPANSDCVHMYKDQLSYLARIRGQSAGTILTIDRYPSTDTSFTIAVGERFLAMNRLGQVVQGKIINVKYDGRGSAEHHEVTFDYAISPVQGGNLIAI